jgi:Zn-dependent M16 (insulinase) family peptidase
MSVNAVASDVTHPAFEHKRSHRIETLDLTVPMDSTGVAHILEHTALCGSERYPVRDPFFWMIRRSLNTFMNAFTTSDYTAYPFASQNRKDFFNLLDVYLDAVFFSRLDPLDFAQEGHRLEFETPDDPTTPLVYRGVVYNEMKGDSSSPISVLYEELKKNVYPTTTYHYNSGGNPQDIPDLSYEALLEFYRSHYHPSNAVFMTFGNFPVVELQQEFEEKALGKFDPLDESIAVGAERRLQEPARVESPYGIDEADTAGKTHIVLGWLLGDNSDLEMLLKCNLLSDALLDTSASPLRLALETSPQAGAVSPLSGLEETSHEMSFAVGVEGSEPEHADEIEQLVLDTLRDVAEEGIPVEKLEACLHQLELSQREIGGDGAPFGLQLMFSCMSAAIHRGDPIQLLDLDPVIVKLRGQIHDPSFFPGLVKELLLDNPHRVRLVLYPDPSLNDRRQREEVDRLGHIREQMSTDDCEHLVQLASQLAERQAAEEDVSVLPSVGINDIAEGLSVPTGNRRKLGGGMPLTSYEVGTNGLTYHQVVVRMPDLSPTLSTFLPYYSSVVSEIGSGGECYLDTQHRQHSETGGISAWSSFRGEVDDPGNLRSLFTLSSRTLNRKARAMLALVQRTLCDPNFDEPGRVRDLIKQMRVRRSSSVTGNGHGLAMTAASAVYRPVQLLNHQLSGLNGISSLKAFDDRLDEDGALDEFIEGLRTLSNLLSNNVSELLLVADGGYVDEASAAIESVWLDNACPDIGPGLKADFEVPAMNQAWLTSTQVNFCASACPTVAESHQDAAALSVLAAVLRNGFLHGVLREKGGAYGGGATHDSTNGVFRFYSYRDPNLESTFDAFRDSIDWLLKSDIKFELVEEAILGLIGTLDAPGSPAGQARQAFHHELFGRSPEHRAEFRQRILGVTVDDIKRVGAVYLNGEMSHAVVTNEAGSKCLPAQFEIRNV